MIHINLDASDLIDLPDQIKPAADAAMKQWGQRLVIQARAHAVEQAHQKLHTRRQQYVDALTPEDSLQVDENTYVLALKREAIWIEDGLPEHNMLDDLLKSGKAKTAKDGSKYLVVPFQHNKGPTQQTPAQANLLDTIKSRLKEEKIPYGKLETDAKGKPRTGLLHSLDITKAPIRTGSGPGQGKGPIGQVMQGPTGIPLLKGIRIYQKQVKNKDGSASVKRFIMTFRVASSKHKGQGRWDHPGLPPVSIMDETYDWIQRQWDHEMVPKIIDSFLVSLNR